MLDLNKTLKKTKKINENLVHRFYESLDKSVNILEVDYLNKKFVIEKSFKNNYAGNEELQEKIKEFNTEDKVKQYFGL